MLWGIVALVMASVSLMGANAEELVLTTEKDNTIEGIFYPTLIGNYYDIKFSVAIEQEDIVSRSAVYMPEEDRLVEFVQLKLPLSEKNAYKVKGMLERVLQVAATTHAAYLEAETNKFPSYEMLTSAYYNLATELNEKIPRKNRTQIVYSIMYHLSVVGAASRIARGAEEVNDICSVDKIDKNTAFICDQDRLDELMLQSLKQRDPRKKSKRNTSCRMYRSHCSCRFYWYVFFCYSHCYWLANRCSPVPMFNGAPENY